MSGDLGRRRVLEILGSLGIGTATFQRALAAQVAAEKPAKVTAEMIERAEWVAGLELTEEERKQAADSLSETVGLMQKLRDVEIPHGVSPAVHFEVLRPRQRTLMRSRHAREDREPRNVPRVPSDELLAFLPVTELGAQIRAGHVSSVGLTKLYLERLKKYQPLLNCVVTLTEDLAYRQAERADAELRAGRDRGPLHGIPWGAKDLIAVPGYPTTWGAPQYRDRVLDETATVARRLEEAGAVLVAKLSLGALAMGDQWFGGRTRNPWNPARGSSGSSAGSVSAVVAGLVGFAIGSETLGSIITPCRICGGTGLRPTFGRVSRAGCMPLSWTMDKIGPIARSVQDCGWILNAIHGPDGLDCTAVDEPFHWPPAVDLESVRVGYLSGARPPEEREELQTLRRLGVKLVPIELPRRLPTDSVLIMLTVEAATAFDRFTRDHVSEGLNQWPRIFREGQFIPAVEYLRAARVRSMQIGRAHV